MSLSKNFPRILFEDQEILVCHKPSGVPAQTNRIGTPDLVSILKNSSQERIPFTLSRPDSPAGSACRGTDGLCQRLPGPPKSFPDS